MQKQPEISELFPLAVDVLRKLIAIPSVSRQEAEAADFLQDFLSGRQIVVNRIANNIWAQTRHFNPSLPCLLLNSHLDTVPANAGYTRDPWSADVEDGKIFGLGSNDAGGALVSLLAAFIYFASRELPFNIIFSASAEEEISGKEGLELMMTKLPAINMAIVGEPTEMKMAVAEKGLLVLDCLVKGVSGHAARDEGENAIYKAMEDIRKLKNYEFDRRSNLLGPVHMSVTVIETKNKSHNVIPGECSFVVDLRVNELYTHEEVVNELRQLVAAELQPRSMRLKSSFIAPDHPLVLAGAACGMESFGSPTLSDMALMNFPAVKIGPGDSRRSHTADEYIFVEEIKYGVEQYVNLITRLSELIKTTSA